MHKYIGTETKKNHKIIRTYFPSVKNRLKTCIVPTICPQNYFYISAYL